MVSEHRHALRWLRGERQPSRPALPPPPLLPGFAAIIGGIPAPMERFYAESLPVGGDAISWELRDNYQGLAGLSAERTG